jgi:hypothetical protein
MKSNYSAEFLRNRRPTINPYRDYVSQQVDGLSKVGERICWDLRPVAWRSRARLRDLANTQSGGKAVIVCNGPSLLKSDLSLVEGLPTFGLNKINLLFDKRAFRPSFIVAVNRLVIEQNDEFFNATSIPLFISHNGVDRVKERDNVCFLHTVHAPKFAKDVSISVNDGGTVTFVALQLAFHMGFRKVALVGCDHNFATKGPSNQTVTSKEEDKSHFDPKYFGAGVQWQLPDLEASEMGYRLAANVYEAHGGEVINATEGGLLEIFRRQSLKDFVTS